MTSSHVKVCLKPKFSNFWAAKMDRNIQKADIRMLGITTTDARI